MKYVHTESYIVWINPASPNARLSGPAMWNCPNTDISTSIILAVSKSDNLGSKHPSLSFRAVKSTKTHHRSAAECLK